MKKVYFILLFIFISINVFSQKYISKTGTCQFSASVPAFEPIEAKTETLVGILDVSTAEVAALVEITSFEFPISLMQEHFNENYMDSEKYPKATFKGKFESFSLSTDSTQNIVNGKLNIHGVEKAVSIPVTYFLKDNQVIINGRFEIRPEDFKIKIPKVITQKIAEVVLVELDMKLTKK